jgi:DGQHR domain-containing protein
MTNLMSKQQLLELPALAVQQGNGRELYGFAVDGKKLHEIAQISRLGRSDGQSIVGYQRPEVVSHIAEIRNYLESEGAMLPNAIVVAFDSRVTFRPLKNGARGEKPAQGHLLIPVESDDQRGLPGWIVDGQQRAAAIRDAHVESFPVFVTAFVTDSVAEQREQFILVNSTKPLPKGLIYELLPSTDVQLSTTLQRKRFPAYLLERLNFDSRSPLHRAIQTPTVPFLDPRSNSRTKGPRNGKFQGFIKDNSVLRMLENSINDGALYRFKARTNGEVDTERMLELLFNFWEAVRTVFSDAWYLPPAKSRLTHGVGIMSMGHLMDAISDRFRNSCLPTAAQFAKDLEPLKPLCSWTTGYWDFGPGTQRKWNEVQNTSKDIQMVANYLLIKYKQLVWR